MKTTDNYPINYNILAEDFREQQNGTRDWSQEDAAWLFASLCKMCTAYDSVQETLECIEMDDDVYFPERSLVTESFEPTVMWTPYVSKDGRAGMRCQKLGNLGLPLVDNVTFIYFNPSTDGEGEPDTFVYEGPHNNPTLDSPLNFYNMPFGQEDKNG